MHQAHLYATSHGMLTQHITEIGLMDAAANQNVLAKVTTDGLQVCSNKRTILSLAGAL